MLRELSECSPKISSTYERRAMPEPKSARPTKSMGSMCSAR